jgi:hypothetical protein
MFYAADSADVLSLGGSENNYSVYTVALNISSCAVTAQIYNSKNVRK